MDGSTTCVIVVDFKENLKLGREPCEQDDAYYKVKPCSVVGAVAFLGGVQVNIDHVSSVKNHSSEIANFVLSKTIDLLSREYPDKFAEIQTISVWSDCGSHFRSEVQAAFTLFELPKSTKKKIKMNFFVEKHGKSHCDSHFQKVECYILAYSEKEPVLSPDDVKTGLLDIHARVNEGRKARKLPHLSLFVEVYSKKDIEERRKNSPLQELPLSDEGGIHSTYCLCKKPNENFVRNYSFSDVAGETVNWSSKYVKVDSVPEPAKKERIAELRDSGDAAEGAVASTAFLAKKRRKLLGNLEKAGNPHPGLALPSDLLEDGISVELRAVLDTHALPRPAKVQDARDLATEMNRLVVFKDDRFGCYLFGRLLGAVEPDDVRISELGRKKFLFREVYYPHKTVCEIIEQEAFVEQVRPSKATDQRTAFFLRPTAAVPVESAHRIEEVQRRVEPDVNLRHSHPLRLVDYWAQCCECQKWRIVDYGTYCVARQAMSTFQCVNGNCEAPQTEEEVAGLEEARHF